MASNPSPNASRYASLSQPHLEAISSNAKRCFEALEARRFEFFRDPVFHACLPPPYIQSSSANTLQAAMHLRDQRPECKQKIAEYRKVCIALAAQRADNDAIEMEKFKRRVH